MKPAPEVAVDGILQRLAADPEGERRRLESKRAELAGVLDVAHRVRRAMPAEYLRDGEAALRRLDFELELLDGLAAGRVRRVLVNGAPAWFLDPVARKGGRR